MYSNFCHTSFDFVLSVLRLTVSDYLFGNFKHFCIKTFFKFRQRIKRYNKHLIRIRLVSNMIVSTLGENGKEGSVIGIELELKVHTSTASRFLNSDHSLDRVWSLYYNCIWASEFVNDFECWQITLSTQISRPPPIKTDRHDIVQSGIKHS